MSSAKWWPSCLSFNVLMCWLQQSCQPLTWWWWLSCKHAIIMCQNKARISPMLAASGWFWPSSDTLWHVYRATIMVLPQPIKINVEIRQCISDTPAAPWQLEHSLSEEILSLAMSNSSNNVQYIDIQYIHNNKVNTSHYPSFMWWNYLVASRHRCQGPVSI